MADDQKYKALKSGLLVPIDLKLEPIIPGFVCDKPQPPPNVTRNESDRS